MSKIYPVINIMSIELFYNMIRGKKSIENVNGEIKKINNDYEQSRKKILDEMNNTKKNKIVNDFMNNFNSSFASNNLFNNEDDDKINMLKSVFNKIFPEQFKNIFGEEELKKQFDIVAF